MSLETSPPTVLVRNSLRFFFIIIVLTAEEGEEAALFQEAQLKASRPIVVVGLELQKTSTSPT